MWSWKELRAVFTCSAILTRRRQRIVIFNCFWEKMTRNEFTFTMAFRALHSPLSLSPSILWHRQMLPLPLPSLPLAISSAWVTFSPEICIPYCLTCFRSFLLWQTFLTSLFTVVSSTPLYTAIFCVWSSSIAVITIGFVYCLSLPGEYKLKEGRDFVWILFCFVSPLYSLSNLRAWLKAYPQ